MQKARNSSKYKYQSRQRTQNSHERIDLLEMEDLTTNLDGDVEIVCVELVVDKAHHVVYIPTHGCMNLAATVNVLMYDRLAKTLDSIDDHAQVIANRDNKNRLRVKESCD
ncbi:TPA: hypothetical protein RQJ57_001043 [Vibrio vulnificus]|nr:hypothetical protein [Vibrio vulnificus]